MEKVYNFPINQYDFYCYLPHSIELPDRTHLWIKSATIDYIEIKNKLPNDLIIVVNGEEKKVLFTNKNCIFGNNIFRIALHELPDFKSEIPAVEKVIQISLKSRNEDDIKNGIESLLICKASF